MIDLFSKDSGERKVEGEGGWDIWGDLKRGEVRLRI
jgi:hypothetical protein